MPFDRHVALCRLRVEDLDFGFFYRCQDRGAAVLGFVNADGQVDFVLPRILLKCVVESEDGIGRCNGEIFKHGNTTVEDDSLVRVRPQRHRFRNEVIRVCPKFVEIQRLANTKEKGTMKGQF